MQYIEKKHIRNIVECSVQICNSIGLLTMYFDLPCAFCVLHLHSVIAIIFDNCMICASSYSYYCTFIYIRFMIVYACTYTPRLSSVLSR